MIDAAASQLRLTAQLFTMVGMQSPLADDSAKKLQVDLIEIIDASNLENGPRARFCYTKMLLKSVLQLMGCKTRVAHKARRLLSMEQESSSELIRSSPLIGN